MKVCLNISVYIQSMFSVQVSLREGEAVEGMISENTVRASHTIGIWNMVVGCSLWCVGHVVVVVVEIRTNEESMCFHFPPCSGITANQGNI